MKKQNSQNKSKKTRTNSPSHCFSFYWRVIVYIEDRRKILFIVATNFLR